MTEHLFDTQETKQLRNGSLTWLARSSIIFLYLGAIVGANLLATYLGPKIIVFNALVFISLDLSSRDRLHEAWKGRGLPLKMGILIGAGSLLSWILNREAGSIASASFFSFMAAAIADSVVYSLLGSRGYLVKVNGSNIAGALVDSILFPWLAYGGVMIGVSAGLFIAKVGGGFFWALILQRLKARRD